MKAQTKQASWWHGSRKRHLRPNVWSIRVKSPPWSWGIPCAGRLSLCLFQWHPAQPPYLVCRQARGELMIVTVSGWAGLLWRRQTTLHSDCHSTNNGLACTQTHFIKHNQSRFWASATMTYLITSPNVTNMHQYSWLAAWRSSQRTSSHERS